MSDRDTERRPCIMPDTKSTLETAETTLSTLRRGGWKGQSFPSKLCTSIPEELASQVVPVIET